MQGKLFRLNIRQTILLVLLISFPIQGNGQRVEQMKPSLKGKKILYVYGGWEGHNPRESVDWMVPKLKAEGAIVTVVDSLAIYTNEQIMAQTDLIIQNWTMGKITPEQFEGLEKAVINGTGLAGWHGGLGDAFRDNLRYQFMVGGQFLFHPGGSIDYTVDIVSPDDPITKGLNDFELQDTEQYYMLVDPNIQVLAISKFTRDQYTSLPEDEIKLTGSTMPVVWKKNYGKGRVFFSSIGHKLIDFDIPEVMTLQMRGFRWASEGKYRAAEPSIRPAYAKKN